LLEAGEKVIGGESSRAAALMDKNKCLCG